MFSNNLTGVPQNTHLKVDNLLLYGALIDTLEDNLTNIKYSPC